MHTLLFRSADRVFGSTNDFRITLPYLAALANADVWCVKIERVIIPKNDSFSLWYSSSSTALLPPTNKVFVDDYIEIHLDFGAASKSYDSRTKGQRIAHLVGARTITGSQIMTSFPDEAVKYHVSRPNLNELHVRVVNKRNEPATVLQVNDFPTLTDPPPDISSKEVAIPEWVFVMTIEPVEKYDS